ncbi:hypothetical protein [Cupriavidus oxalaticus]|uniref:hypothetical protein n=1 Tax=Cupriavidus oxalaticus TaxID=96344 RepID=UPI0014386C42|nr:hypothetical protein [Cupriavidus oxalaticus]
MVLRQAMRGVLLHQRGLAEAGGGAQHDHACRARFGHLRHQVRAVQHGRMRHRRGELGGKDGGPGPDGPGGGVKGRRVQDVPGAPWRGRGLSAADSSTCLRVAS